MTDKEHYEEILKGLKKAGFLKDAVKYNMMHQEILNMNNQKLKRLKREFKKLETKHIKSKEDFDRFYHFVISSNPSS